MMLSYISCFCCVNKNASAPIHIAADAATTCSKLKITYFSLVYANNSKRHEFNLLCLVYSTSREGKSNSCGS